MFDVCAVALVRPSRNSERIKKSEPPSGPLVLTTSDGLGRGLTARCFSSGRFTTTGRARRGFPAGAGFAGGLFTARRFAGGLLAAGGFARRCLLAAARFLASRGFARR